MTTGLELVKQDVFVKSQPTAETPGVTRSWSSSQGGPSLSRMKVFDARNMYTEFEQYTLHKSRVTCKVKVCGHRYRKTDRQT